MPDNTPEEKPEVEVLAIGAEPAPASEVRRRTLRSMFRPGRGQLIAAVILFVVGMAAVMQVRMQAADETYSGARREDLIALLDGLGEESRRLDAEIAELERTKSNLETGADTQRVAREEAAKRIEALSILAGTVPASGSGIKIGLSDPQNKVTPEVLLDMVEEMRDAGAEVIEFNDTIRIVGDSWFAHDAGGLVIDGESLETPLTIEVIGDPHALEEAAKFPGGLVSEIKSFGGQIEIDAPDEVVVESLHTPQPNEYARPASPPPTPR